MQWTARIAAGALLAYVTAGKAFAQKTSKESMQYQEKPSGDKQCSNCAQFIPDNACQIVEGTVSPHGYCIAWQRKH